MSKYKVGDKVLVPDSAYYCRSFRGNIATVSEVHSSFIELELNEKYDMWSFSLPELEPALIIENSSSSLGYTTIGSPREKVSEELEELFKESETQDLTIAIPSGTTRLEGVFDGYKVTVEKI